VVARSGRAAEKHFLPGKSQRILYKKEELVIIQIIRRITVELTFKHN
jgi:hypothetical protein